MINFDIIHISKIDDYDEVLNMLDNIFPSANHKLLISEIKNRINQKAEMILVEYPYRDYDFSSVYTNFYAKKHQFVSRECTRLHFFTDQNISGKSYIGYLTVRDSNVDSRGRAILSPGYLLKANKAYILHTSYSAHIMGSEMKLFSYPWMAQDTDISVCAHIAVWSIINYYAHRYPNYKISSIGEIADSTPQYLSRKTPSEGLNLLQVSELLSNNGFYPLVLKKRNNKDQDFFRAIYSYIESGIPMVAAMTGKEHAVAIIGHGDINTEKLSTHVDDLIYCADLVDEYIISNDNDLPFTCVSRYGSEYSFNDLDYVIIPLYEKMYLNSHIVYKRVESLIKAGVLNTSEPVVLRVYLTSTRSLKREALKNRSMNDVLKSTLLKLHTPQFVWCADISTTNDYNEKKTTFRIIIDSTAGTYENDPWLLIHDDEKIVYRDGNKVFKIDHNIKPYEMYVNNLKEVAKK